MLFCQIGTELPLHSLQLVHCKFMPLLMTHVSKALFCRRNRLYTHKFPIKARMMYVCCSTKKELNAWLREMSRSTTRKGQRVRRWWWQCISLVTFFLSFPRLFSMAIHSLIQATLGSLIIAEFSLNQDITVSTLKWNRNFILIAWCLSFSLLIKILIILYYSFAT